MYKGGVWLKKKKAIVADLKKGGFPPTFTEADLKLGYKASATDPLDDKRITGEGFWLSSYPKGTPDDLIDHYHHLDDYFFLPASGWYFDGWLNYAGTGGWYWSDNTAQNHQYSPCGSVLQFTKDGIGIQAQLRVFPSRVQAFE